MRKHTKKLGTKVGLPPESFVYVGGTRLTQKPKVSAICYNDSSFRQEDVSAPFEKILVPSKDSTERLWLNIVGLDDSNIIKNITERFGVHPLILEDILNTHQRPKVEQYGEHLFLVLRVPTIDPREPTLGPHILEQISIVLGPGYILTFQESDPDFFTKIFETLRADTGRLRGGSCDYLLYRMLDCAVDTYFLIFDQLGEQAESLEETILLKADPKLLFQIQHLKHSLVEIRRIIWGLREMMHIMHRGDFPQISKELLIFFRDVYDHTVLIVDGIETLRDSVSSCLEIYLSVVNNNMNSVMKVLTGISTIILPLTVITGIYGMNFQYMPELRSPFGYPLVLIIMLIAATTMAIAFYRKGWFS